MSGIEIIHVLHYVVLWSLCAVVAVYVYCMLLSSKQIQQNANIFCNKAHTDFESALTNLCD